MNKDLEKLLKQLQNKNFESAEDMTEYLQSLTGHTIDDIQSMMGATESAFELKIQDLLEEVTPELSAAEAKRIRKEIFDLLKVRPDTSMLYYGLAILEQKKDPYTAVAYLQRAEFLELANLDTDLFDDEIGNFWQIIETRNYMRILAELVHLEIEIDDIFSAVHHAEMCVKLNNSDNLGIRYILMQLCIQYKNFERAAELIKEYPENSAYYHYNKAFIALATKGHTKTAQNLLNKAKMANLYIYQMLANKAKVKSSPAAYGSGDLSEANAYLFDFQDCWYEQIDIEKHFKIA